jgi:AraC-like DNA-binding protein
VKKGEVRPIYSQQIEIRSGWLRVLRFCLNRHLPERDWVAPHKHAFSQFLVYLNGRGVQEVEGEPHPVRPGSLCYLPPGVAHAFVEVEGRRPLCLAIDFRMAGREGGGPRVVQLTESEMSRIRHGLAGLSRWQAGPVDIEPASAASVLQIVDGLLRASAQLARQQPSGRPAIVNRVLRVLAQNEKATVGQIAAAIGYHPDHLNRLLKGAAGVSVGQLRSESRLQRAKDFLKTTKRVHRVAEQLGFEDPNYFSRWFRRQTGLAPGAWQRQAGGAG